LIQTKTLKQETHNRTAIKPYHEEEDEKWIKKVIQEEHIKPLEVWTLHILILE
jgi:hypothetical protein